MLTGWLDQRRQQPGIGNQLLSSAQADDPPAHTRDLTQKQTVVDLYLQKVPAK